MERGRAMRPRPRQAASAWQRRIAGLVVLLGWGAPALELAHRSLVRHQRCADHGGLVHEDHASAASAEKATPASHQKAAPRRIHARHEATAHAHCGVRHLALGPSLAAPFAPTKAYFSGPAPAHPRRDAPALSTTALSYAPKASPPAV